jgi:hypothetical protein
VYFFHALLTILFSFMIMLNSSVNVIFRLRFVYRHKLFISNFRHVEVVFSNTSSLNRTCKGLFAKSQVLVQSHGFILFVFGSRRLILDRIQIPVNHLFDNELVCFMSWAVI